MRMADGVEGAGYWLPSEFLTDEDFVIDRENFNSERFTTEFPYDFQTQKLRAMSASPQSTLGSNNRSQYDALGGLIYLAAGQLAKLKLNPCPAPGNRSQIHKQSEIPTPPVYLNTSFGNICPRAVRGGLGHVAWAPRQGRAAHDGSGAAAKKVCAGTGVFLPRRYDTISSHSSAPRSRQVCSASPFQGRETALINTKPFMYHFVKDEARPPQPKIGRGFASDHNSALARTRALVLLQQRSRSFLSPAVEGSQMIGRDHPGLPPEWTY